MPHSPSNSSDSTTIRAASPLPPPFEEWYQSLTAEMLEPRGHIPESVQIARRNSLAGGSRITLRRQRGPLQITNAGLEAQVAVVVMSLNPPNPPGGRNFEVHIPWQWWRTQRRLGERGERPFTYHSILHALRDEIMARIKGEGQVYTLMNRKYAKTVREELEECIKNLPSAAFTLDEGEDGSQVIPAPSRWQDWTVEYGDIHESTIDFWMRREGDPGDSYADVELSLQLPFQLLSQSPSSVSDWLLMQIGL